MRVVSWIMDAAVMWMAVAMITMAVGPITVDRAFCLSIGCTVIAGLVAVAVLAWRGLGVTADK